MSNSEDNRIPLNVITLSDEVEKYLRDNLIKDKDSIRININSHTIAIIMNEIDDKYNWCRLNGFNNIPIVCRPDIRLAFRRLIEKNFPRVQVISYMEVPPNYKLEPISSIEFTGYKNTY